MVYCLNGIQMNKALPITWADHRCNINCKNYVEYFETTTSWKNGSWPEHNIV